MTKENECVLIPLNSLNFILYLNHVSKKLFHTSVLEQSKMKFEAVQM